MEASIDASAKPTSGLATCSVIIAVADLNVAEISGAESLTRRYSHMLNYTLMYLYFVPRGSVSVALLMEILNSAPYERNASKAIGKLKFCSCSPVRKVTVDVAGT